MCPTGIKIDHRAHQVLTALVEEYIRTASPVGSRTLVRDRGVQGSPATVRNVMGELADMGFLDQPHTSAGRMPTDQAFRYYVNHIIGEVRPRAEDRSSLEDVFRADCPSLSNLISETARVLSELSRQVGVILVVPMERMKLKSIHLAPGGKNKLRVFFTMADGTTEERVITDEWGLDPSALHRLTNLINLLSPGRTLVSLRRELIRQMEEARAQADRLLSRAVEVSAKLMESERPEVYIRGQAHLFDLPDFTEVKKIRDMVEALEEKQVVVNLLESASLAMGTRVIIGEENKSEALNCCSVISSTYGREDMSVGTLGIIGPTRMDYARLIPLVTYTSELISQYLKMYD